MHFRSLVRSLVALVVVALGATAAWAQDYNVSAVSGRWVTPPSNASNFGLTGDDSTKLLNSSTGFPSWAIPYFGKTYTQCYVSTNNFVNFGNNSSNGCCSASAGPHASGATYDGVCAPGWTDGYGYNGTNTPVIWTWQDGTAPNRRFIIAWTNWSHCCSYNGTVNMQIQFHETSGRIVFAYTGTWTVGTTYGVMLDEQGGSRYVRPPSGETTGLYSFSTNSPNDWQFDPKITNFTGTAFMDAIVSDASGIGNSQIADVPATGLGVELQDTSGKVLASGTVLGDGSYRVSGTALDSTKSGVLVMVTASTACSVSPSTPSASAPAYSKTILSTVSFGSDTTVPAFRVNDANDSGGTFRKPAQIALSVGRAASWITARTGNTLPRLEIYFDDASKETSRWVEGAAPYLRIGGAGSGNQDAFDKAIVTRGYGRHVIKNLAGLTTNSTTLDLDTNTDAVAALSDGMGTYLYCLIEGQSKQFDGLSASTSSVFDFESPNLTTAKGPDVGGWFAAAMYDLIDPANESWDQIDGASGGNSEHPFQVFGELSNFSMIDFIFAWESHGYGGAACALNFIHHGIISDDNDEPDDSASLAFSLGNTGVIATGRTLNPFNEDWFSVTVPQATDAFFVDLIYNRAAAPTAQVILEIRSLAGQVLGTGSFADATGPMTASGGAVAQGTTLRIRVAHVAGSFVGTYSLQAFGRLAVDSPGPFAWTVGRSLVQPINVMGGIPPFNVSVKVATPLPAGLAFDPNFVRVLGVPVDVGTSSYTIATLDSGAPQHSNNTTIQLTINPPVTASAPFLTGVAVGKATDISLGLSGGTPPVVVNDLVGEFPEGLSLSEDFHIVGTTNETGGGRLSFNAVDVAGSSASVSTTLVACARLEGGKMAMDLGAGDTAAAGFYFDAIAGTTANIGLSTAKKRAQRELSVLVVGPDGKAVEGGKIKVKKGRATLKGVPLALSGRYFFVFAATDGGDASQLIGSLKTILPRKASGGVEFDFGDAYTFDFGALSGAKMTVSGKTTLKMELRVAALIRPDGTGFPLEQITERQGKGRFSFSANLDQSGTWTMTLRPKQGPVGEMKYTLSLKQPKGVDYSAD